MATKKVAIPISELPPLTADGKYLVRYRVSSDDKNRVSAWSPTYKVLAPYITNPITAAVSDGTKVVYTTQEVHGFVVGDIVSISHPTSSSFAISNVTITAVTSNTFTIASTATVTYVAGGRVNPGSPISNSVTLSSKTANLIWTMPDSIHVNQFDIFMSVASGSPTPTFSSTYKYVATTTATNYSTIIPDENNGVRFLVQAATSPSTILDRATIFYSKSAT